MLLQFGCVWESPGRSCGGDKTIVCIFAVRDNKAFLVSKHRPFHSPVGKKTPTSSQSIHIDLDLLNAKYFLYNHPLISPISRF